MMNSETERPGSMLPAIAPDQIADFFRSPELEALKREICDIGRRLWGRAYVDGNGGNISVRVASNLVLCTPTLVSKGFMQPEDLASELLMHLAIFAAQPKAKACVHAHPPTATGYAVCGIQPPSCMIPEMEIFIGQVAVAPYMTPGSHAMGEAIGQLAVQHNTILMANHGVVAWGFGIEDAYFKMEILEAYCKTMLVTAQLSQLGSAPNTIPQPQMQELLAIKKTLGIPDPRTV